MIIAGLDHCGNDLDNLERRVEVRVPHEQIPERLVNMLRRLCVLCCVVCVCVRGGRDGKNNNRETLFGGRRRRP